MALPLQRPGDDDACVKFRIRAGGETLHLEDVLVVPFTVLPVILGKNLPLYTPFQSADALPHDVIKAFLRKLLQVKLQLSPRSAMTVAFSSPEIILRFRTICSMFFYLRRVTVEELIVKREAVGVNEQPHHYLHFIRAIFLGHSMCTKLVGIKTLKVKRDAVVKRDDRRPLVDVRNALVDVMDKDILGPAQEPEGFVKVRRAYREKRMLPFQSPELVRRP